MSPRHSGTGPLARNGFRPRLELLEDRSVPAVVTTTLDNGDNVSPTPGSLRAAIIEANADALVADKISDLGDTEFADDLD